MTVFDALLGGAPGPPVPGEIGSIALDTRRLHWRVLSDPFPPVLLTVSNGIFPR